MKDITIRAIITGMASVLFKDLFDIIYRYFILSNISMIQVAAGAFISLNNFSIIGLIIGLFAHYTVGGIIGLLFLQYLNLTNKSFPIIKGLFAGLAVWIFLAGMLLNFGLSEFNPNDEASNLMLLIDHLIFGLSMGILTKIFVLKERSF
jgi:hypothetical protein